MRLAEALRQTVVDFPFVGQNRSFSVTVSIGLVSVASGAFTLADVLKAADAACYLAKEKGRNRIHIYQRNDTELSIRHGEMEWVGRIHQALEEDRLCLYAQEILPMRTESDSGRHIEILVRMIDERGELVPPMAFIPAAERYNLMPSIDRWVIRTTFSTLAQLRHRGENDLPNICSINLSGASFIDERFLEFVIEQFTRFSISHTAVCFEITETAAIANLAKAERFIHELSGLGCKFSLMNSGTGMSSFADFTCRWIFSKSTVLSLKI